jgi:hypothetical protein
MSFIEIFRAGKKPSAYWWLYQSILWSAAAVFLQYEVSKGRISWWVPAVAIPVGFALRYVRQRYYASVVTEARARRKARRKSDQMPT